MKDELKKLGLTEGEASVYLALLKLNSSTVGAIVKDSGVSYSKIYEVLGRLSISETNKRIKYLQLLISLMGARRNAKSSSSCRSLYLTR